MKSLPTVCEEFAARWSKMKTFKHDRTGRCRVLAFRKFHKALDGFGLDTDTRMRALADTLELTRLAINAEE